MEPSRARARRQTGGQVERRTLARFPVHHRSARRRAQASQSCGTHLKPASFLAPEGQERRVELGGGHSGRCHKHQHCRAQHLGPATLRLRACASKHLKRSCNELGLGEMRCVRDGTRRYRHNGRGLPSVECGPHSTCTPPCEAVVTVLRSSVVRSAVCAHGVSHAGILGRFDCAAAGAPLWRPRGSIDRSKPVQVRLSARNAPRHNVAAMCPSRCLCLTVAMLA